MVKIRLRRQGAKRRPSYRIVAAHDSGPRGGKYIEQLGIYDPLTEPATLRINAERAHYWLSVGAQPSSDRVRRMLQREGILSENGKPAVIPGTLTDPLTRTLNELLRHVDPELAKSSPRTVEFAAKLAQYARALSESYPEEPTNQHELDDEMRSWIREFAAREFSTSMNRILQSTVDTADQAAD